jgi:hypothetical protein
MVQCDVDQHDVLFEDNNNCMSNEVDVTGKDSRDILDYVIQSIKEEIS